MCSHWVHQMFCRNVFQLPMQLFSLNPVNMLRLQRTKAMQRCLEINLRAPQQLLRHTDLQSQGRVEYRFGQKRMGRETSGPGH